MSIIERALQKAQHARQAATAPDSQLVAAQHAPAPSIAEPAEAQVSVAAVAPDPAPAHKHALAVEPAPGLAVASASAPALALPGQPMVRFDLPRLRELGRVSPEELSRQTDEEMRRIKWPVLSAVRDPDASIRARNNVVLVTSAIPAEGKTFIALNLAISIARDRELSVILIDGDVAKPALTPALKMDDRAGLVDVLDDPKLDVNQIIYPTDIEGLSFVPAGKWHEYSAEFFSSARMQQIVEKLSQMASPGIVVLDSPPLLATSDAQAASRYVGQVVMVVRADSTPQREVNDALALLDSNVPARAVLNCVESSAVSRYYGNYYYGYAQYGNRR